MRLTLRTLLAYLDDILEPAQTKEIGAKIAESSVATALVDRIREVVRRRRISAPDLTGSNSGVDPNTLSEYLDNILPPNEVADVEKICLESDINLAEVAACHQILTLVLGEPVEISTETRNMMYAVGPKSSGSEEAAAASPPQEESVSAKTMDDSSSDEYSLSDIPDYLKPNPVFRRLVPYASVFAILLIWVGLLYIDPTFLPKLFGPAEDETLSANLRVIPPDSPEMEEPPAAEEQPEDETPVKTAAKPAAKPKTDSVKQPPQQTEVAAVDTEKMKPALDTETPVKETPKKVDLPVATTTEKPTESTDQPKTDGQMDAEKPAAPTEKPTEKTVAVADTATIPPPPVPAGEMTPAETKPVESKPTETKPAAPAKPAIPAVPVQYNSFDGVLLRRDNELGQWYLSPHRSLVHADEQIAVPEPYRATLDVGERICQATLLPHTAVTYLGPTEAATFGFRIRCGRMIIQSRRAAEDAEQAVIMAIGVDSRLWRVELLTADTVCGIEILPRLPDHFEQDFGDETFSGRLYVLQGSVRFADGAGQVQMVNGGESLSLTPVAADATVEAPPLQTQKAPLWLTLTAKRVTTIERRYASLFEKEFDEVQPVSLTIPATVKDRTPRISELAVRALALTEHHSAMLQALAQSEHEESRQAAIGGLREWLPRKPENRLVLKENASKLFREEESDIVYRLLWGYNAEDLANPTIADQLLTWMEHQNLAIRELAFFHVRRITGRDFDYRAVNPAIQRQASVKRWRDLLAKEGGLKKLQ